MADGTGLARVLAKPAFDAESFVAKIAASGEDQLLDMKHKMQMLNDDTAQSLKKNVYKNYSQFIETAKEISILEGEMYQLSHMLSDQKILMSSMMAMSLVSDKAVVEGPKDEDEESEVNPEEETRKNLAFLLDKVEGCSNVAEVPGRHLIHNGDLVELDTENLTQVQRVHAFLLNDSFMIATWVPNRRGPVRYRFQGLYELDSLAVVNVRDVGSVKNAFKILMFPETRMYQTDSTKSKRQWLDILDDTKKKKANKDKQKKEANTRLAEQQIQSLNNSTSENEKNNPFSEEVEDELEFEDSSFLTDEWLELPEDLDMCIAQRDFEGAVDLVSKVNNFLRNRPRTPAVKEFRARIDHRVKLLTDGLMGELQVSPERSLRGGPRAARRAVTQLIRLGKSSQACELFLKNRTALIKYNIRQLKFEGATTLYVRCLCGVFFTSLSETAKEFLKAFPDHNGCFSAFVVWSKHELQAFIGTFCRQVFESKSSLTTITDCVSLAKLHCLELKSIGLDLSFSLTGMLETPLRQVVLETRDQLIEGVKYRSTDDLWRPMNHLNKRDCDKFLAEMLSSGLEAIKECVYDECFISLTMNTTQFSKSVLIFAEDLLKLFTVEWEEFIADCLAAVFKAQINHMETSLKSDRFVNDEKFILKNAKFILENVVACIEKLYQDSDKTFPTQLQNINAEYRRLKTISK
ncbi:hypothetical protein LOTGIDRAFT_207015 [Lottia gigantea]|uniref:Exocyst complex component 8 n=1 Tax=Lottia gigantea TaxID=225164 RepID=V4A2T6_LOTGI|nr:hypothetical protein LOTGIDRAFT_207015 [Lottia gigantea]ESO87616.1 hypothetical protein LOTGIDRAFT_207015 [Lottia gigantea]